MISKYMMSDKELAEFRVWAKEARSGNVSVVMTERMHMAGMMLKLLDELEKWKELAKELIWI